MATSNERLNLIIGAKDQATSQLKSIQKSIAGIGAAYLSWQGAKQIIDWTVGGAMRSQKVWAGVAQAVKTVGDNAEFQIPRIKKFAGEMQAMSGKSDEAIGEMIQAMVQYGMSTSQALANAQTTLDFAIAKQMDLRSAADLVGKAFVGYTGTLSRYGIILDESLPKSEKFAKALEMMRKQTGGAAAAEGQTLAGQISRLSEAIGDMGENIGNIVAGGDMKTFIGDLAEMVETLNKAENLAELMGLLNLNTSLLFEAGIKAREDRLAATNMALDVVKQEHQAMAELEALAPRIKAINDQFAINTAGTSKLDMSKFEAEQLRLLEEEGVEYDAYISDQKMTAFREYLSEKLELSRQNAAERDALEDQFASRATDTLMLLAEDSGAAFRRMKDHFVRYFIQSALKSLSHAFVPGLLKILGTIFDTRENDLMAMKQGRDYAYHFKRGAMNEFGSGNAIALNIGNNYQPQFAMAGIGSREPVQQINIHFNAPVTDKQFVQTMIIPEIERVVSNRRSRLAYQPSNLTGRPDNDTARRIV